MASPRGPTLTLDERCGHAYAAIASPEGVHVMRMSEDPAANRAE